MFISCEGLFSTVSMTDTETDEMKWVTVCASLTACCLFVFMWCGVHELEKEMGRWRSGLEEKWAQLFRTQTSTMSQETDRLSDQLKSINAKIQAMDSHRLKQRKEMETRLDNLQMQLTGFIERTEKRLDAVERSETSIQASIHQGLQELRDETYALVHDQMKNVATLQTDLEYYDTACNRDLQKIVRQLAKEMEFLLSGLRCLQDNANTGLSTSVDFSRNHVAPGNIQLFESSDFRFAFSLPRANRIDAGHPIMQEEWQVLLPKLGGKQFPDIKTLSFVANDAQQWMRSMVPKFKEVFPNLETVLFLDGLKRTVVATHDVK